jgi:undecaprenyl-diphosphatase
MDLPGWLQNLDERAFLAVNRGLHDLRSDAVETGLRFANEFGSAWVFAPIVVCAFLLSTARVRRLAEIGLAALLTYGAAEAAKTAFPRARPQRAIAAAFADGRAEAAFGTALTSRSFPSGHATTAFAAAGVLCAWAGALPTRGRRRLARALALALAALTGIARIYAGAHWPLDVLAGAAIGSLAAFVAVFVVGKVARGRSPPPASTEA